SSIHFIPCLACFLCRPPLTFSEQPFAKRLGGVGLAKSHSRRTPSSRSTKNGDGGTSAMANKSESVRVCVRIRPLSTKEKQDGRNYIVFASKEQGEISLANPEADDREPPKKFTFDAAIPPECSQMDVYNKAAMDIVDSGYSEPPEEKGIIPNSFKHIFDRIAAESDTKQFMVYASYLEIYNEEIRDLLAQDPKNRLELKENLDTGVYVKDLTSKQVTGEAEIDAVMQQGKKNRSVGATLMNQTSSRSHSMFTITVEACSNAVGVDGKQHICIREYQEKIKELREALAAQEKSVAISGGGEGGGGGAGDKGTTDSKATAPGPQIIERIIEKTVVKREGVSEELLKKLEEDARREKLELKQKAQAEMKALLAEQSRTEEERGKLEKELATKAQQKAEMAKQKDEMLGHLQKLEKKLISGGKVIDKAAKQERELRAAQAKVEEQKRQEMLLARELAEKEDSNVLLEEQFATLQDEVDDKTRKLKKLWAKHKAASTEVDDLKAEFQAEKEDMLDTIRELTRQLKMKHLLLGHFVPFDEAATIEKRAKYDPEVDEWKVDRLEVRPSALRPKRPVSRRGARRIESEYGRRNKLIDPINVRWRADNVVVLDMEMPERRTKDFEYGGGMGVGMNYWLERVGAANDEDVEITFENEMDVAPSSSLLASAGPRVKDSKAGAGVSSSDKCGASGSPASGSATSSSSSAGSSSNAVGPSANAATSASSSGKKAASTSEVPDKSGSSKKASSKRPPTARW
ncbi:hypothetical protein PybrP1_000455, partial [[Pythium] brassicae (nom. inval.)]